MPELIEPVPATTQENSIHFENDVPPSEINISDDSDISTDPKNNITKRPKNIALKYFLCFIP